MSEVRRGIWYSAGSFRLRRYDKGVKRHSLPEPGDWRDDRELLMRFVREHYPDAGDFRYRGGVLRFRWNDGEGSGEAYESGTTPGEATWPGTSDVSPRPCEYPEVMYA